MQSPTSSASTPAPAPAEGVPARAAKANWAILLLAVVVRVGLGSYRGEALLEEGNGLYFMHEIAQSLVRGDGYAYEGMPSVFHQPGYVVALAGGYAVLGATWQAVLAVNTLIGTALVAVTMRTARHLDPRAVLPAGAIAALHPILAWHGISVADTTLFSLCLVGWVGGVLAAMRDDGWRPSIEAGVWLGLAFLTRPSLLPLIPFGIGAIWFAERRWRPALRFAVISLILGGAIALPWAMRNHGLTGKFPLMGTHGPESVWAANTKESPRATELDSTYDAVSSRYEGTAFDVFAFQAEVTPTEAVERAAAFQAATTEWVGSNFGTFLWMCSVRFGRIWDVRYHPTRRWDRPMPGATRRNTVHLFTQIPILLLAVGGLVLLLREPERRPEALFVVVVLAIYTASHSVGAGYTRVRVPIDPLLVSLAACALARARMRWCRPQLPASTSTMQS